MELAKRERSRNACKNYVSDNVDADDLSDLCHRYGFNAIAAAISSMMLVEKMHHEALVRTARKNIQEIEKSEYTLRYLTDNLLGNADC